MNPNMTPLPPGYTHVQHTFEPVFDEHSRILILGSFPSVKSRENQFYYGHPQNRFWKLMAQLLEVPVPQSIDEKKTMLLTHGLALWDVIASCDIKGSSDSSIKNAVPADISRILKQPISRRLLPTAAPHSGFTDATANRLPGVRLRSVLPPVPQTRLFPWNGCPNAGVNLLSSQLAVLHPLFHDLTEFVYTGAQCLSGLVNGHVRILFIKRHALIVEI